MPEHDPDALIDEILRSRKASITRAPLPSGAPSWNDIRRMTWGEIEDGARRNQPGFREIRKLLTNRRFEK